MKQILGGLLALLLAGCAAGHHELYSLDDFDLEWRDTQGLVVSNIRLTRSVATTGPVLFLRQAQTAGCYEGFYNPHRIPLEYGEAREHVEGLSLCRDADAKDGGYRLDLRSSKGEVHVINFNAGSASAIASVDKNGSTLGRVRLPANSVVFRDHPELLGAILALGVLPARAEGFYELK